MNPSPNSTGNSSPVPETGNGSPFRLQQGTTVTPSFVGVRPTALTYQRATPLMTTTGPGGLAKLIPVQQQDGNIILHQKPTKGRMIISNSSGSRNTVVRLVSNPNRMNGSPGPRSLVLGATSPYAGATRVMLQASQAQKLFPSNRIILNSAGRQVIMKKPVAKTPTSPSNSVISVHSSTESASPRPSPTKSKSVQMRLRSRANPLPLHTTYFSENGVLDKDADVIFQCGDGGRVKGHKLILASQSKFFTDLFRDQPLGEISTVSIPDIQSGTMKLIILLAYKNNVVLDGEQMEKVKEFFDTFGLDFENMNVELNEERSLDVGTDKVQENIQRQSNLDVGQKRKLVPSFTSAQLQRLSDLNKISNTAVHPDANEDEESDFESFKIEGYPSRVLSNNDKQKRKEKLHPRKESEASAPSEPDEDDLIKHWMENVGKSDPEKKESLLKCTICESTFQSPVVWEWHENRHYTTGIYKCSQCDTIKSTARLIWIHESEAHDLIEIEKSYLEEIEGSSPKKPNFAATNNQSTIRQPQLRKMKGLPVKKQAHRTYHSSNAIKVGQISEGTGNKDMIRVAKLHWLYVCARCDNCSDSIGKAQIHFGKCYPDGEALFESTVTKYRQGFYGKSKCPLCPRRYVSNGGFSIHSGHQHQDYRKMFSYIGNFEDKLKCSHCERKFGNPEDFHMHLHHGQRCVQFPIIPQNTNTPTTQAMSSKGEDKVSSDSSSTSKTQTPNSTKKKAGPTSSSVEEKKATPAKPQRPVIPSLPPPRSARLAKRASALLMAKVLNDNEESDEEKTPKKRRTSAIDYPPADCPICGASEVANISQHLANEHEDINVSVNRISTELLRCRKCYITFAICDLLSHTANCGNSVDLDKTKSPESPTSSASSISTPEPNPKQKRVVEKASQGPIVVPPDLGCSPIDKVEYSLDELKSAEVFQKSLTCPVCDSVGRRLGDISWCLKHHGIFRCTLCLNTYKSKDDYDKHLRACHFSGTRVKCLFCEGKTFINVGQTIAHYNQIHNVFLPPNVKKGKTSSVSSVVETAPSEHQPQAIEQESVEKEDDSVIEKPEKEGFAVKTLPEEEENNVEQIPEIPQETGSIADVDDILKAAEAAEKDAQTDSDTVNANQDVEMSVETEEEGI